MVSVSLSQEELDGYDLIKNEILQIVVNRMAEKNRTHEEVY